jgi:hypothetical protein
MGQETFDGRECGRVNRGLFATIGAALMPAASNDRAFFYRYSTSMLSR